MLWLPLSAVPPSAHIGSCDSPPIATSLSWTLSVPTCVPWFPGGWALRSLRSRHNNVRGETARAAERSGARWNGMWCDGCRHIQSADRGELVADERLSHTHRSSEQHLNRFCRTDGHNIDKHGILKRMGITGFVAQRTEALWCTTYPPRRFHHLNSCYAI